MVAKDAPCVPSPFVQLDIEHPFSAKAPETHRLCFRFLSATQVAIEVESLLSVISKRTDSWIIG